MNLCYLYNKSIRYPHTEALLTAFERSELVDVSTTKECPGAYGVYIVDIATTDKTAVSVVRNMLKEHTANALIYLILSETANAMFYQLAYLLKARAIVTPKQDVAKVIHLIKTAHTNQIYETKSLYVGRFLAESLCYMIFKQKRLSYASDSLLRNFNLDGLREVEEKICKKLPLDRLLETTSSTVESGRFFDDKKADIVKSVYKNDEHLVILERYDLTLLQCESSSDLATRLKFIEFLKERLAQKDSIDVYTLVTVKINNFKKIGNLIGKSDLESFIGKFLRHAKEILGNYLIFAEYNQDFFVATYKNTDFAELEKIAQKFYTQMEDFLRSFQFKTDLSLYVFEIETPDLGAVLSLLDSIRANKISKKEIQNKKIKYVGKYADDMSDKEIIALLFESSFINDTDLKLVNVYKGMVIDSPTKILKRDVNAIYVVVKQIQGAVMSLTKETVIRSDAFDKDIKARVAYVDRKRKIAKLENFKVLDETQIYKDNCRVDFAKKNMAIVALVGTKISAEILDISAKSISLKINKIKALKDIIDKSVTITFSIPTHRTREGEVTITENARVSYVDCTSPQTCRMVCDFDPASKNKNIILEYVHNRQVEIVEELKKMVY